jgi:predicted PurR-regulated permease PerM
VLVGIVLAIVLSVLFLKDGRRFQRWALAHLPPQHHDLTRALAGRAWDALSGYLRGAALLGAVEGVVVGLTLWLLGSPLYGPMAVLTFIAAFFPVVGAILAGIVATLVALASGPADALIMAAVAIVVQQLDGDILAPVIYGRSLRLHPALVVVALSAGGVLGGIAGAFLAVPVTGALSAVAAELWDRYGRDWAGDEPAKPAVVAGEQDGAPS